MNQPLPTPAITDAQGRVVLEAYEVAELGGFLAGITGWVADGHPGWQNLGFHVGMALDLPEDGWLDDTHKALKVLDKWVERLNPPSVTIRTTHRRWR